MAVRFTELAVGAMVDRFRIVREIGRGGHGIVYEAHDTRLGRRVAIKILLAYGMTREQTIASEKEAHLLSAVESPYVCALHDLVYQDGAAILVMELLQGQTLEQRLLHEGPLPWPEVVDLGKDLLTGVLALHAAAIVHRDIKPGNLRFSRSGILKILDFSAAHASSAGASLAFGLEAVGTIPYMAPEQFRGASDQRADIYSCGAVLYEMACGHRAFDDRPTGSELCSRATSTPRPRSFAPDLPVWLDTMMVRALHPDPGCRFQRASDLLEVLSSGSMSPLGVRRFHEPRPSIAPPAAVGVECLPATCLETATSSLYAG